MIVAHVTDRPAAGLLLAYPTSLSRGYVLCLYYVVSVATTLSIVAGWTDSTGTQSVLPADADTREAGAYLLDPIPLQAVAGSVISISASATQPSDARFSVSLKAI